jgi:hypothetical protein
MLTGLTGIYNNDNFLYFYRNQVFVRDVENENDTAFVYYFGSNSDLW